MANGRISPLRAFAARVRGFLGHRKQDSDFDQEVQTHLQLLTDRFVAQGMSREDAAAAAQHAIQRAVSVEDKQSLVSSLQHTALLRALRGDTFTSAKLLGYVDALFQCQEYYRERTEIWSYEKLVESLRLQMTQKQLATVMTEGAKLSEDEVIALALGQLSTVGALAGDTVSS